MNLYFDHGSGQGGDIIDLGCQLFQCDTKALLQKLGSEYLLFHLQQSVERNAHIDRNVTPETKQPAIQITGTKDLGSNVAISQYLQNRGIDLSIARPYCKEVYYQVGGKSYYAAGFENRSGGYELRSQHFKGSSSPKDITHVNSGHKSVCVGGLHRFPFPFNTAKTNACPQRFSGAQFRQSGRPKPGYSQRLPDRFHLSRPGRSRKKADGKISGCANKLRGRFGHLSKSQGSK
ncbi:hypothetical protein MUK70_25470 [Dyadobacter chenwenxiniae]|uniref:Uncharacterized protein n=1 Tax=Dyadobacter chenwenxiniae TaxID=2906456 RepID=A0A9X1PP09_9BACT|nr:hypothetical protein [Dyadobacter chenwenxiniae]MCF0064418.1 hypothetical protein [Dyadobacter chenwenxiniae]UON82376.1 hypothetical protein MUK70_25470 [Dyadobacter chenwenxiniae]